MPDLDLSTNNTLPTESQIKKSGFNQFMSSLFGWRRSRAKSSASEIQFTKVDLGSDQRINQALVNKLTASSSGPLNQKLDQLFNSWLNDNTDKVTEIINRKQRVDQISYAILNDPYINRTVALYADEATQLDDQNTVINIETPDPKMTKAMYSLLNRWGVTQVRIRAAIEQLGSYGDAFWANRVTEKGVERIIPLQQLQVTERLEFNPVKALEIKKRREGTFSTFASSNYLIDQMLTSMEDTANFADLFDTKLFGFSIDNDLVVPPWTITHFRIGAESSEFYPMGTSPILGALAPFKQTQSTIALQSLARMMSFPVTLYKVKTSDNMDEGRQFAVVNRVRESYDNIGVSPTVGSSEVYTVNTKIWIPDGLLDVDVKKAEIDTDNVADIELYQDRTAVAVGLPKSFFTDEWYGLGNEGKALTQQYKPFARKVYALQSAFLEGLSDLFRIHFAITGEFDFRVPFTLSMRFPSVEESDDRINAKKDSIDLANEVVNLIKSVIGATEEESLPPDIIRDILNKYTFIDPSDLMKWSRDAKYIIPTAGGDFESEGSGGEGASTDIDLNFGNEGDEGDEDIFEPENIDLSNESLPPAPEVPTEGGAESGEGVVERRTLKRDRLREKHFTEVYNANREDIYFKVLQENAIDGFVRHNSHVQVFSNVNSVSDLMLETLANNRSKTTTGRLKESLGFSEKKTRKKASK